MKTLKQIYQENPMTSELLMKSIKRTNKGTKHLNPRKLKPNEIENVSNDTINVVVNSEKYGILKCLINKSDYPRLKMFRWSVNNSGYVSSNFQGTNLAIEMHRLVMSFPIGLEVDHENRNKLDNRSENLRICNRHQNMSNRSGYGSSKYLSLIHI